MRRGVDAEQLDPPARRPDQVEHQPDRRRLPGAVRAEEAEHLPGLDREIEVHDSALASVALRQALGANDRFRSCIHSFSCANQDLTPRGELRMPIGVVADAVQARRADHGSERHRQRRRDHEEDPDSHRWLAALDRGARVRARPGGRGGGGGDRRPRRSLHRLRALRRVRHVPRRDRPRGDRRGQAPLETAVELAEKGVAVTTELSAARR